jgi:hypothetical protein
VEEIFSFSFLMETFDGTDGSATELTVALSVRTTVAGFTSAFTCSVVIREDAVDTVEVMDIRSFSCASRSRLHK